MLDKAVVSFHFLYSIAYIDDDDLKSNLQMANVSSCIGNLILNHLLFADDDVIFAPSVKGL